MSSSINKLRKILSMNVSTVAQALVVLKFPGDVITDDMSSAWRQVGSTNILKLHVTADTYVAFSPDDATAATVSVTTTPAVLLPAGMHYVLCQDEWVRMSLNPSRVELLKF